MPGLAKYRYCAQTSKTGGLTCPELMDVLEKRPLQEDEVDHIQSVALGQRMWLHLSYQCNFARIMLWPRQEASMLEIVICHQTV